MAKFVWQDGTLVSKAKVEVGGTIYEVDPEEYSGTTPLSASNLNAMVDQTYEDFKDYADNLINSGNGYVKLPDGTMICYGTSTPLSAQNVNIAGSTASFPESFIEIPLVTTSIASTDNSANDLTVNVKIQTVEKTRFTFYEHSSSGNFTTPSLIRPVNWIAIGKWK